MESKMECILASIFDTFEWILGGKLGGKMDQKSIQKGIGKRMEKITIQERRIELQKSTDRADREARWRGRRGPSLGFLRISFGYFKVYFKIYPKIKEIKKD